MRARVRSCHCLRVCLVGRWVASDRMSSEWKLASTLVLEQHTRRTEWYVKMPNATTNMTTGRVKTFSLAGDSTQSPLDRTRQISLRSTSTELKVPYESAVRFAAESAVAPCAGRSGVSATVASYGSK